ncbi:MAG: ester cyclase [Chloroflexi bacterium]|nr:ester cyclase [Chloroflexota bacterium]
MTNSIEGTMNLIERLITIWNAHSTQEVAEIYAADYQGVDVTDHNLVHGQAGAAQQLERYVCAFPDLTFTLEQSIVQSDSAALYWKARGTHLGTMLHIPPTGHSIELHGMSLLAIQDGKIKQAYHLWDMAGLLRSLGLLPDLEPAAVLGGHNIQT